MIPRIITGGGEIFQLIDDLLRSGRLVRLRVTGRSMAPWLEDGMLVTLRRVPTAALTAGTVVLFLAGNGRPVLHRVIRKVQAPDGSPWFLIKGDACAIPDGLVAADQIIGTIVGVDHKAASGRSLEVMRETFLRPSLDRLLAIASHRSPRLFRALSHRLVPRWRRRRV